MKPPTTGINPSSMSGASSVSMRRAVCAKSGTAQPCVSSVTMQRRASRKTAGKPCVSRKTCASKADERRSPCETIVSASKPCIEAAATAKVASKSAISVSAASSVRSNSTRAD
jgi:hypothetical protein